MKNLHEVPRFSDKLGYLYVEHAVVDQDAKAIVLHEADGSASVPAASLAVLMLGPGTTITHAAVKTLADNNCQLIWSGEYGIRFYCHGLGGARSSRNLIRQAKLVSNDLSRLQVVVRMYCMRFREEVDPGLTLQQLRGKEGVRVRQAYAEASRAYGVPWSGRTYKRTDWASADPINRALSAANSCLYGLVHAGILSGGYSPALGFIHTGKQLSFVYDVADMYKAEFTIPTAFEVTASGPVQLEREVRIACRDRFRKAKLMQRILPEIKTFLDVPGQPETVRDEYADDAARPAELWEPASVSSKMAIGRILKLDVSGLGEFRQEKNDGGDNSGTSDAVTAG